MRNDTLVAQSIFVPTVCEHPVALSSPMPRRNPIRGLLWGPWQAGRDSEAETRPTRMAYCSTSPHSPTAPSPPQFWWVEMNGCTEYKIIKPSSSILFWKLWGGRWLRRKWMDSTDWRWKFKIYFSDIMKIRRWYWTVDSSKYANALTSSNPILA